MFRDTKNILGHFQAAKMSATEALVYRVFQCAQMTVKVDVKQSPQNLYESSLVGSQ
jgi:hypothetical protein